MQAAATEAEFKRRGAGVRYILNQLKAKSLRPSVPVGDVAENSTHKTDCEGVRVIAADIGANDKE